MFTELLKYPWGTSEQALLQESSRACRTERLAFCLFSLNINRWGGHPLSPPLQLLPISFLAVTPTEIYASGRTVEGQHLEYQLSPYAGWGGGPNGHNDYWRRIADGTVAKRRASARQARQPPTSVLAVAAHGGIAHPAFLDASPGGRAVGIIGHAPEPAFIALDPRLQAVQTWLASNYPNAQVSISGLDQALTHAQITVWDSDLPPTTFSLGSDGMVTRLQLASPRIATYQLGRTHLEPGWVPGVAVAVTLPPARVALRGVVVTPVPASADLLEAPLHAFRPQIQAFAQHGIAVVQMLAPIPDRFASDADGAVWRETFDRHLQQVLDHASRELGQGKSACLYGERLAGELALAAGLSHVGCIAAVNAILNAPTLSQDLISGLPVGFANLAYRYVGPTEQMLHREFPAAFGNASNRLEDSTHWVPRLPQDVMLSYDALRFADETRGYTVGDFAAGSAAFRNAARKGGRSIQFYLPDPRFMTFLQRDARMIDAVTRYITSYCEAHPLVGPYRPSRSGPALPDPGARVSRRARRASPIGSPPELQQMTSSAGQASAPGRPRPRAPCREQGCLPDSLP